MASWREAQSSSVIEGQVVTGVVTGEVQPPARYAVREFSVLAKFIRALLFFVLRTFRPLVRILLGLIAGFTLLGCVISYAVFCLKKKNTNFLWTSVGMISVSFTCLLFLCYYDLLILCVIPASLD